MDKQREAFEKWRKNVFKQKYVFNVDGCGYKDHNQDVEFESFQAGWQAAIASQEYSESYTISKIDECNELNEKVASLQAEIASLKAQLAERESI